MRFYDGKDENDKIIENVLHKNDIYEVKYLLSDEIERFTNTNENLEKIKNIMYKQAENRDKELLNSYDYYVKSHYTKLLISILGIVYSSKNNLQLFFCLFFIALILSGSTFFISIKKLRELRKYHNFLEIKDELKKEENKDILDIIEPDKLYQLPLDIDTLDSYTNYDISVLKKELMK